MELPDNIFAAVGLWQGDDLPPWLRGDADNSDLPEPLVEFANAIGRPGALRLAAVFGGTEQIVSAAPEPEDAISQVLGLERARQLGRHVCPECDRLFPIPYGPFTRRTVLRHRIRTLFLQGWSSEDIIRSTGIARETVLRMRRELAREGLMGAVPAPVRGSIGSYGGALNEGVILARAIDLEGLVRDGGELPDWLQGVEDDSDLPVLLTEIAFVLGRAKALLIAAYLGGARVHLPFRPEPSNRIAQVVGQEDATRLAAALLSSKGLELEIPRGPLNFANYRTWRMRRLILAGMPESRVALEVGITRRNVTRAKERLREEGYTIPTTWMPYALEAADAPLALAGPSTSTSEDDRS